VKVPLNSRSRAVAFPLALFFLALVLRILLSGAKSLWGDEFYAAGLMNGSFAELVRSSFQGSPHPPLAFLGLKISALLFGVSEAGLRGVPALLTSLAVVPLFLFVKSRTSELSSFIACLLWAVSPYSVSLGQEAWLYGILAFAGFTFIWLSDLAWRGNRKAALFLVPVGLLGMLVQHLFFLFLSAGFLLYFTLDKGKRVSIKSFFLQALIMALVYLPFLFPALEQAGLRSERVGYSTTSGVILHRFLFRVPTVTARLIAGGIAGELSLWSFRSPVTPAIFLVSLLSVVIPVVVFLFRGSSELKFRIWAGGLFIVPLLLFFKEDPTARHLSIMWLPLAMAMAHLAERHRPAVLLVLLTTVILLLPYYRLDTFPYHRSNWRRAVAFTEIESENRGQVVILAGQNGGLAWDYYSSGRVDRIALGGETPYEVQATRSTWDPASAVDSLLESGTEVFVVHDIWGGASGENIAPRWPMISRREFGPHLEVVHFGTGNSQ